MPHRRFSEEEFTEVLKKATELQSRALVRVDGAEPSDTAGMSLEDMQAIAREVGIEPSMVARAASLLEQDRSAPLTADRYVLSDSMPGELTDDDKARLLHAIRDTVAQHGSADLTPTGIEWSTPRGEPTQLNVSVYNLDGRNEVRVAVDRNAAAILTHLFPTIGGLLAGVAVGASLEPGLVGGAAVLAGGAGAGFAFARALWHRSSRTVRARAARIVERVTAALPTPSNRPDSD